MNFFFFQAEDGIRDWSVTGVQTCALPIWTRAGGNGRPGGVRGGPTLNDPSVQSHGADGGIGDRTTGIVEKDVVAFRARLADRRRKICDVAIVDHCLVTVAGLCQRSLFGRTGEPDRAATRDMCELPNKTSDAAGCG